MSECMGLLVKARWGEAHLEKIDQEKAHLEETRKEKTHLEEARSEETYQGKAHNLKGPRMSRGERKRPKKILDRRGSNAAAYALHNCSH